MDRRHFLIAALVAVAVPAAAMAGPKVDQGLVIHAEPAPLPPLAIKDGDGKPVAPRFPMVLNLWASWCLPCVAELPSLDRLTPLAEAEGVTVMALSLDRMGAGAVKSAYARIGASHLAIHTDDTRQAADTLKVPVLPVTLLVDRQGRELARYVGPAAWDGPEARALVAALATGGTITPAMAPPPVKHRGAAP